MSDKVKLIIRLGAEPSKEEVWQIVSEQFKSKWVCFMSANEFFNEIDYILSEQLRSQAKSKLFDSLHYLISIGRYFIYRKTNLN